MPTSPDYGVDPIQLEVIKNALLAVTEEQGVALQRAAYSTNIKTRHDYSCSFLDARIRAVAQAFSQPSHLAAMAYAVPNALAMYGIDKLRPGDGILTNIPHLGSIHLNDMALISPCYWQDSLVGYLVNFAHHVDVGGTAPGSIAMGREIYQEGIVVPPIRFVREGEIDESCFALISWNVRSRREVVGDFRAQLAANNVGQQRLNELLERYGQAELERYAEALLAYTEHRTRECFKRIPDGHYRAVSHLDRDAFNPEPTRLVMAIEVSDGRVEVDLTGSDAQHDNSLNASIGVSYSGVAYALKCLIDRDIPVNDGFYRAFSIHAPARSVVNCEFPAGVSGGAEIAVRCTDMVFRALSEGAADLVMACTKGTCMQIAFGAFDPRKGESVSYYETMGGGEGARALRDGQDGIQCHVQNTENAPVEEVEAAYPFRILRHSLVPDSEGPGRRRGGLGLRRDYLFPFSEATFSILADRTEEAPWGLCGGAAARCGQYELSDETVTTLASRAVVQVPDGTVVSIRSPGGGGYGPPLEREPERVLADVAAGKISPVRARSIYGVVIDGGGVNAAATADLRARKQTR